MSHSPDHNLNTDLTETMDIDTARQVEDAKISRRAALRKLGFGAGMAAFAMLGVDDFARMAGKRLERMAGDNKTANAVAKEFQQSGVAFASYQNPSGTICQSDFDCSGCGPSSVGACCSNSKGNQLDCCAKSGDKMTCCAAITTMSGPGMGGAFDLCMAHTPGGIV